MSSGGSGVTYASIAFVRKLRQKLEKASPDWSYIHTHFGIGYRFAAEPVEGAPRARREAPMLV